MPNRDGLARRMVRQPQQPSAVEAGSRGAADLAAPAHLQILSSRL
jgi:hypothetical protein